MVLIVGGSGSLEREVARRLLERGNAVCVSTRSPDAVAELASLGAAVAKSDLAQLGDWPAAPLLAPFPFAPTRLEGWGRRGAKRWPR